jgi:hypothetical protein
MKRHWRKALKVAHFGLPQPPAPKADMARALFSLLIAYDHSGILLKR